MEIVLLLIPLVNHTLAFEWQLQDGLAGTRLLQPLSLHLSWRGAGAI